MSEPARERAVQIRLFAKSDDVVGFPARAMREQLKRKEADHG